MNSRSRRLCAAPVRLCEHGLVPRERLGALAEVAARYAVAITPAMAELIDR